MAESNNAYFKLLLLDPWRLGRIAERFGPRAEVIADARAGAENREESAIRERIIGLIKRRPCTSLDISQVLGIPVPETAKILDLLAREGAASAERHGEALFYSAVEK